MRPRITAALLIPLLGIAAACADVVAPATHPLPRTAAADEEIPPEFDTPPTITESWIDVGIEGDQAYAMAYMRYWANRAVQNVKLTLRNTGGTVAEMPQVSESYDILPAWRELNTLATLALPATCGLFADGNATHTAWHEFFTTGGSLLSWNRQTIPHSESKAQPACQPCTGGSATITEVVYEPGYDPYGTPDGNVCAGADGGPGSGIQFQPGDFTQGETVDWSTGKGNGGESVCGDTAVVEYECFDYFDPERGWIVWGCGYVTTC